MTRIEVEYFALYREQRGAAKETLATPATTIADLLRELAAAHPALAWHGGMQVAVNDELANRDRPLVDGDRVLLFPPVAGG